MTTLTVIMPPLTIAPDMIAAIVEMTPAETIIPKRMTNAMTTAMSVETAPVLVHLLCVECAIKWRIPHAFDFKGAPT